VSTLYIVALRFLDYEGGAVVQGGLKRYVYNIARLAEEQGHEAVVLQKATTPFERPLLERSKVVGVAGNVRASGNYGFNWKVNRLIPPGAPVVYASMELGFPFCRRRAVGIQHGIFWDGEAPWWKRRYFEFQNRWIAERTYRTICVDTNYINFYRTAYVDGPGLRRLLYIPNWADTEHFGQVEPHVHEARDDLLIAFPRRTQLRRGYSLMAVTHAALAKKYPRLRFWYVVGDGWETDRLLTYLNDHGVPAPSDQVRVESLPFERMGEVYRAADITVVPTLFSEGTSLSCIEAMYHGSAIVSTHIGGLGNLVIDGFNGLLIDPAVPDLTDALERLIADHDLRARLGAAAHEVAHCSFTLAAWEAKIRPILEALIEAPDSEIRSVPPAPPVFGPEVRMPNKA